MSTMSGSASNASPPAPRSAGGTQQHTRTYQACKSKPPLMRDPLPGRRRRPCISPADEPNMRRAPDDAYSLPCSELDAACQGHEEHRLGSISKGAYAESENKPLLCKTSLTSRPAPYRQETKSPLRSRSRRQSHEPPCVRCRRESKECFFSATRRKRKPQDGGEDIDDGDLSDYEIRNGRKRLRSSQEATPTRPEPIQIARPTPTTAYVSQPLTPGGSVGRYEPLRRPPQSFNPRNDEEDQKVNNQTAAILQTKEVYSGHDALNLLFEAAGRNGDIDQHHRTNSGGSLQRPMMGPGSTPGSQGNFASPQTAAHGMDGRTQFRTAPEPLDPQMTSQHHTLPDPPNEATFADAVKAWSKFRFVRAGWLTAREAIAYMDYFYIYLSPLTPIVVPDYRDHALHGRLLKEEPMLTVTLLTISSRFHRLEGPGASSRYYAIHEKLWKYLQGMIDRMIWGQEQFGGGFCGAGQQPGSDVNPLSRKGLRTLGTVESLMLLTEWHPRALHFPPGDDDDELIGPDDGPENGTATNGNGDTSELYKGVGDQRIDSWLEPCWRSDRMCWMLLGNAMALAFEIGVFDDTSEREFEQANERLSHATVKAYYRRKNHLKDLLIIYVTQTSGRLGLSSMLPQVKREGDGFPTKTPLAMYQERIARIQPPPPQIGMRPDGQRLPYESVATQNRHAVQDLVLDFWNWIAKIMEGGNLKLFPNRRQTRELLKTGKYEELLRDFQTPLLEWKKCFDVAHQVPAQLRHVLTIEYEYTRVYLNSLALQAVVERCTHNTPRQGHADINGSTSASRDGAIPLSTLSKWYGNDRHYIDEVIDASRNVLKVVCDGLYPGDYLRHAPVRTFFRIVSVAIILLKTFALGATEDDVAYSLGLLDRAVEVLKISLVDDVHVGNRFASLVETLTKRIRSRFVRMAASGGSAAMSRAASHSPPRNGAQTPMMPPPHSHQHLSHLAPPFGTHSRYQSSTGSPPPNTTGRNTPNPSLWGIATEAYDPTSNQHTLMPPPNFGPQHYNFMEQPQYHPQAHMGGPGSVQDGYNPDWLALPLDPLLNQWGADITQTAMGPDVGGMDMLDILLNMGGPPGSA
ncbi:hypothetical protein BCR34DRAFT_595522 [Clohesyomyces aquaticus]|uniref:Transcription factor domain-containing protein n=1 Tax=Clohesyomyces aquaticus TaxID=1231657 RepID=A0A1Y2AAT8_9PLEO|nr:hypothetical protein BCR34DRAFT_595522 [Clohesyomyces aquaticus]